MSAHRFWNSNSRSLTAVAGVLAFTAAMPALAHDIWVTVDKISDNTVVADIGFGDRDHRTVADPARLISFDIVSPSGVTHLPRRQVTVTTRMGQPTLETPPFKLEKGSVIAIGYDNGYWLNIPGETAPTNTTQQISPNATDRHWTVKYSKMLYGPGAYGRILNQRLELIALKDPFTLGRGQSLPIRVVYEGKPVSGADLQYDDGISPVPDAQAPKVKTDSNGVATVPVDRIGPYLIVVDLNRPPHDSHFIEYDHIYGALSFDLHN